MDLVPPHHDVKLTKCGGIIRCLGLVVIMLRPQYHVWPQSHHLMKALMVALLPLSLLEQLYEFIIIRDIICHIYNYLYNYIWHKFIWYDYKYIYKLADRSREQPKGSLFNSYYTMMLRWVLLLSLDCSTYPNLYLIMLNIKQGGIKYHFLSLWYDST